jgi:HAD superfamily hydrolase (TIGR01509 family)
LRYLGDLKMAGSGPKLQFAPVTAAVVFDLDGVLLQSEEVWDAVRERYVRERGGRYDEDVQRAMMGMSAPEWSRFLHEEAGVPADPDEINSDVIRRMLEAYERDLPLLPGAAEAVRRTAAAFPLALASSSNRKVFEEVLELAGLADCFRATVSSEEVERGKPAPDVYLEAARRLGVAADRCAAVEDSHAGIRSAKGAGMRVVAIPNATYPPGEEALALADAVVPSLGELTLDVLRG